MQFINCSATISASIKYWYETLFLFSLLSYVRFIQFNGLTTKYKVFKRRFIIPMNRKGHELFRQFVLGVDNKRKQFHAQFIWINRPKKIYEESKRQLANDNLIFSTSIIHHSIMICAWIYLVVNAMYTLDYFSSHRLKNDKKKNAQLRNSVIIRISNSQRDGFYFFGSFQFFHFWFLFTFLCLYFVLACSHWNNIHFHIVCHLLSTEWEFNIRQCDIWDAVLKSITTSICEKWMLLLVVDRLLMVVVTVMWIINALSIEHSLSGTEIEMNQDKMADF